MCRSWHGLFSRLPETCQLSMRCLWVETVTKKIWSLFLKWGHLKHKLSFCRWNYNWTETHILGRRHMHAKSHRMWLILKSRRCTHTQALVYRGWCTHTHINKHVECPTCWDVVERRCLQNLQRLLLSQDPLCGRERTLCFKYGPQHWDKLPATNLLIRQLRVQANERASGHQHSGQHMPRHRYRHLSNWLIHERWKSELWIRRDPWLQRYPKISLKCEGYWRSSLHQLACEFSVREEGCWGSTDTACAQHSKCGWQQRQRGMRGGGWRGGAGGREVKIAHPFVYNSTCGAHTHIQTQRHTALLSCECVCVCMHACLWVCVCVQVCRL